MYKILVIDDEKSIVKGLVETLNREELELQIYWAWTVSEGLSIARKVKLDILCSDINMPVMDGFKFASEVLGYWKSCGIVFLTGYDTFELIYKAIHEFGAGYVLKNEEDKFLDIIKRCMAEVEQQRQAELEQARMRQLLDENRVISKRQIWLEFLRGVTAEPDPGLLKERCLQEHILWEQPVYAAMGRIIRPRKLQAPEYKIIQTFHQIKEGYGYFYAMDCICINHDSYLLLVQKKKDTAPKIEDILAELQTKLVEREDEKMSFFYSDKEISVDQIWDQVSLYTTLLNAQLPGNNPVLISLEEMFNRYADADAGQGRYEVQVDRMLMEKQFIEVADVCISLYVKIRQFHKRSLTDTQMYYKCMGKVVSYIEKHVNYADMPEELYHSYYHLCYMTGIDEIHDSVIRFLNYMEACRAEKEGGENDLVVQKVEAYVWNHISEEVSLSTLAKLVYFNPSYLSRFYKAATGKTVSAFIRDAKIMKAKELLEQGHKKIGDISKLLGFESVGYFTYFFKKQVGITPTDYRNQQ